MTAFLRVFAVHVHSHHHHLVGDTCSWRWRMGNGSKSGTSVFAEEVRKKIMYAREYFTWASPVTWCVRWRTEKNSLQQHIWTKIWWILVKLSDRVQHIHPGDFFFFQSSLLLSSSSRIIGGFYPQRSSGQAVVTGVVRSTRYLPSFLSRIGFSIPTARRFSSNVANSRSRPFR